MRRDRVWWTLCFTLAGFEASAQTTAVPAAPEAQTQPGAGVAAPPPPVGLPAVLTAQPGGMTADQAAARALRTSLQVRAAQANVTAAESAQTEAALQMIPQISLSARYTRLSDITPPSLGTSVPTPLLLGSTRTSPPACVNENGSVLAGTYGQPAPGSSIPSVVCATGARPLSNPPSSFSFPVILDQYAFRGTVSVPISDIPLRLAQVYRAAGFTAEARRLDEEATRSQTATDARIAFYEYMRAQGQAAVTHLNVENARRHRDDVARFVEAGTVARVELLRVEAQVAEAERYEVLAQAGAALAEAQLRQRLHLEPGERIVLGESLDEGVNVPTNMADLTSRALHDRPELASLERQSRALDANLSATRAGMYPSLVGQFNLDVANPNQRFIPQTQEFNTTWDATIQVSWSPTSALVTNSTTNRIIAQRENLAANIAALREGLELEVRSAWTNAQSTAASIEAARRQVVASEEAYRVRRERFLAGSAISTDLTDAERDLFSARLAVVNANIDLRESVARLRRAVGQRERER